MKEQTMAVQRMQDYIEAHLSENITLGDLAEVSLYSPWHSYRIFHDYLDMTSAEYIRRFRLSRSAMKLRTGNQKVIDVAADLGYASVDGFQRAFLPLSVIQIFYKLFYCKGSCFLTWEGKTDIAVSRNIKLFCKNFIRHTFQYQLR